VLWALALIGYLLVPGSSSFVAGLPSPVLVVIAVVAVVGARHAIVKGAAYGRVITRARRNRLDLVKHLVRRPAIGIADATYEIAAFASSSVHHRLKYLASAKVSSRIGCPF
jgi:hypothetical protein